MSVFDKMCEHHKLSNNNNTITVTKRGWGSSFGPELPSWNTNTITEYFIKVDYTKIDYIVVGIVSSEHNLQTQEVFNSNNSWCLYLDYGGVLANKKEKHRAGHKCKTGDTISVIIDMGKKKVFSKKNNDIKTICDIHAAPHIKYRFGLSTVHEHDKITISTDSKTLFDMDPQISKQISDLKTENKEQGDENDKMKKEIQELNEKLKSGNKKDAEIDKMKANVTSLQDEIQKLKTENKEKENQIQELNEKLKSGGNKTSNDSNKTEQSETDEKAVLIKLLKHEINKLEANGNVYSDNYSLKTKDIYVFLSKIGLIQYADCFITAGFTTFQTFGMVTPQNLKDMGVYKLAHRHMILKGLTEQWGK